MSSKFFVRATIAAFGAIAVSGAVQAKIGNFALRAKAIIDTAYPADGPGASVIVTRRGKAIFSGGRGFADLGKRRTILPGSVFRLGSITKQFTAVAILQLVQEGRISLDDPVSRFLPNYPEPGASSTIRQLLNHTSGIKSFNDVPGWMVEANTRQPRTTEQMIDLFKSLPMETLPGQAWTYSNSGYVLLGAILENVTGQSWHNAINSRLTRPLGLKSVGHGLSRESVSVMVRGYTTTDHGATLPARKTHPSLPHAAAGLIGTAADVARWTQALHHGRVIGPELYAAMTTPTRLPAGRVAPYGFGLALGELKGHKVIRHDGRVAGFNNESLYLPGEDITVVVLANSDSPVVSPTLVGRRLAALALGKPYRQFARTIVAQKALAPLLGEYRITDTGIARRFTMRGGKLYMARDKAPEKEVYASADNHFYFPDSFTWFRIARKSDGTTAMYLHQDDAVKPEIAIRVALQKS